MVAAQPEQSHFEFLVPVTKELMRVDEVMKILRRERDSIYELVERGDLEAHQPRHCERGAFTITRRSVVAYLARTALYAPDDFAATVFNLAAGLDRRQRALLVNKLQSL